MRKLICLAALAALCACQPMPAATTGTPATTGISASAATPTLQQSLQSFTVTDLQSALADATAHKDTVAATCYTALIPAVQSMPSLLPATAPKGGFSAFQAARDAVNGVTGLPTAAKSLNVPCAPLVLDAETTVIGLAGKVGLGAAAASLPLPIPLPVP